MNKDEAIEKLLDAAWNFVGFLEMFDEERERMEEVQAVIQEVEKERAKWKM